MAEYIDRTKLKERVRYDFDYSLQLCEDIIEEIIDSLPTIDIVHCSECKYQGIIHNHEYCKLLGGMSRRGQGNWFCADGKRGDTDG